MIENEDYDPDEWEIDGDTLTEYSGSDSDVVIPEEVEVIEEGAFLGCESIESLTIPTSVKSIWCSAFDQCPNIETVTYEGTLAQWCEMDKEDYSLMQSAKSIILAGENGMDTKKLTTVKIPVGVTKIGIGAFQQHASLESVEIPEGVTKIDFIAFSNCTSLASVAIPAGVTEIGGSAFQGCKSLASVTIPASVTEIGEAAFEGCESLKDVTYGGTKEQWGKVERESAELNALTVHCTDGDIAAE